MLSFAYISSVWRGVVPAVKDRVPAIWRRLASTGKIFRPGIAWPLASRAVLKHAVRGDVVGPVLGTAAQLRYQY